MNQTIYDVAILGSGMTGSMLATILAKAGLRVLMLEAGSHPRFAIGESLIPETSIMFKMLAKRFEVPELALLGGFHTIRDQVSANCGAKRAFSFVYHREGEVADPEETLQLSTLTPPLGPDTHLYRQDVDQWLLTLAIRYGVDVQQQTRIASFDFDADGVTMTEQQGASFRARFLVDGAGFRSPIASMFGLRDRHPRFETNSRSMFTHMVNVTPYDKIVRRKAHGLSYPFAQSTLHHVFDGGWMWVIPFDNHSDATNRLCSVGLTLDRDRYPDNDLTAEEEFALFLDKLPGAKRQFVDAKPVRPWIKTGRLQYSSAKVVGDRFCLLPHAAGFIDPLYSGGLSLSASAVGLLASALISGFAAGAVSKERLAAYETFVQTGLDHYDELVSLSYQSWRSFTLWNAWNRVWAAGSYLGTFGMMRLWFKYASRADPEILDLVDRPPYGEVLASNLPEYQEEILQGSARDLRLVVSKQLSPAAGAERIFQRLADASGLPPFLPVKQRQRRAMGTFTLQHGFVQLFWYRFFGPRSLKRYIADMPGLTLLGQTFRHVLQNLQRGFGRAFRSGRDVLKTWNYEWR